MYDEGGLRCQRMIPNEPHSRLPRHVLWRHRSKNSFEGSKQDFLGVFCMSTLHQQSAMLPRGVLQSFVYKPSLTTTNVSAIHVVSTPTHVLHSIHFFQIHSIILQVVNSHISLAPIATNFLPLCVISKFPSDTLISLLELIHCHCFFVLGTGYML